MHKLLEHSFDEIILLSCAPARPDESPDETHERRLKEFRAGESILGRELLESLYHHNCERGCDSYVLGFAVELATKRPYNRHALSYFTKRIKFPLSIRENPSFSIYFQAFSLARKTETFGQWFINEWMKEFKELGVKVLHGEVEASEAFGSGYFYEMWQEFVNQVQILNAREDS